MAASELMEYLEMQDSTEMVTKTELRQALRGRGQTISDRNLTYYASIGLVPLAVRVGTRSGAYPRVVIEQLSWVIAARSRGLSIDAIKELLPLWRWLVSNRTRECIDLNEFELVARRDQLSDEANFAIPAMVTTVLELCPDCLSRVLWVLKDGTTQHHNEDTPLTLNFLHGALDDDGRPRLVAWTQLTLPGIAGHDPDSPTSITLGLPMNVQLPPPTRRQRVASPAPACRVRRPRGCREALPLV